MKHIIIILLFLLLITNNIYADNSKIESIRAYYQEIGEDIKNIEDDINYNINCDELIINSTDTPRAAVGIYRKHYKFYYYITEKEREEKLAKVEMSCDIAAYHFYKEYLYNTDGELIFHYSKSEVSENIEKRYYFSDEKLIRFMEAKTIYDEPNNQHKDYALEVLDDARIIKEIFEKILGLPN